MRAGFIAALALVHCASAIQHEARLHHRVITAEGEATPFAPRGSVYYNGVSLTTVTTDFNNDQDDKNRLQNWLERAASEPGLLYQVALEHEGDTGEDMWSISSAKACHLRTSKSDIINLHIDSRTHDAFAIDYFLTPVAHDGSCPPSSAQSLKSILVNTTVALRLPSRSPQPLLRMPPPMTDKGEPIKPVQEQSFVQKYWPYLAGFLVLQFVLGSVMPEEGKGGAGGGGGSK